MRWNKNNFERTFNCLRPKSASLKFQVLITFISFIPVVKHWLVLQLLVSTELPTQGFPPLDGDGLLHDLDLLCWPPPQLLSHADHAENAPHPPSTTISLLKTIQRFTEGALHVFYEKAVLKNFVTVAGKHLLWIFFLIRFQAWRFKQVFSSEYCETFKNICFKEHLRMAAFVKRSTLLLISSTTFLHELFIMKVCPSALFFDQ